MSTAQLSLRELLRGGAPLARMRPRRRMVEYLAGVWEPKTVTCAVPLFVQDLPVFLEEGKHVIIIRAEDAMEIALWRTSLDVAGNVEEERRDSERRAVKSALSVDIQSGPLEQWQPAIKHADEAIRFAYDHQGPCEALKTISTIWERLDRVSELAAARSRLLMGKVDKPPLAELPEWFEDQEPRLRDEEEEIAANPLAVESAALLVRAALAAVGETRDLEAEIATGPLGRVVVDWQIPGLRLEWMVEATDLPWPSVKVYQVFRPTDTGEPKPAEAQIFHNAFDVANSFVRLLRAK